MATPGLGHDRTRRPKEEDDDEDPVDSMINRTGCAELHWAVQECMAEKKDWRKCQPEVQKFRDCIENSMLEKQKS
ncbi:cytochrome c oxidase assembly factor 4 homolog, mitochondrial-like [Gigantopelta aegis]|uniref:cytochrome c oxidase assembly factor 4 homolog, mitochondrial-like n=1 Tax=Gigantopelta aegis TaxID=1735272 RepID=UPI001B88CCCA|nr:cytochrome c oxidase assembly factor 4 homolog, mitochondrial-like [Gigantopelta aegis]